MATIRRFEDMIAWQKARELTKEVYKALVNCRDRGFNDQIQRASVSVMSNLAEGFERGTKQEFLNYLYIAKGSAGEVRAQLYVGLDVGYLNNETFKYLNELALDCSRLIYSFTEKLKGSNVRGEQFRPGEDPAESYLREITKKGAPEVYERFYGKK